MKFAPLLLVASAVSLGACEAHRALRHSADYEPAEIAWSKRSGTASVSGTASGQLRGKRVGCSSGSVSLVTRSAYADETIRGTFGNIERASVTLDKASGFTDFDRRYFADARTARCDENGSFTFSGLPAGEYYVVPYISSDVHVVVVGGANYTDRNGMLHMQRVSLAAGQHLTLDFN